MCEDGWGECGWGGRGVVNTGEQSPSGLFPERLFLAPLRDYLTIFLIVQGRLCTPPGDSRMKKALFRAWSKSQANQPEAEQPKCSSTKPLWNRRREQCLDASLVTASPQPIIYWFFENPVPGILIIVTALLTPQRSCPSSLCTQLCILSRRPQVGEYTGLTHCT